MFQNHNSHSLFQCNDDDNHGHGHSFKRDMMLALIPAVVTLSFQKCIEEVSDFFKRKREKTVSADEQAQMQQMEEQATADLRVLIREEVRGALTDMVKVTSPNQKTATKPPRHNHPKK